MTDKSTQEIDLHDDRLHARISDLHDACAGCDQRSKVVTLITALIEEGVNTTGGIITFLKRFGFDRKFVGAMVNVHTAPKNGALWRKSADGTLTLID